MYLAELVADNRSIKFGTILFLLLRFQRKKKWNAESRLSTYKRKTSHRKSCDLSSLFVNQFLFLVATFLQLFVDSTHSTTHVCLMFWFSLFWQENEIFWNKFAAVVPPYNWIVKLWLFVLGEIFSIVFFYRYKLVSVRFWTSAYHVLITQFVNHRIIVISSLSDFQNKKVMIPFWTYLEHYSNWYSEIDLFFVIAHFVFVEMFFMVSPRYLSFLISINL